MTVTPLGRDQDCSHKNREPDVLASWFLDPGGWSKIAAVSLYFIFPGICTLSLFFKGIFHFLFKGLYYLLMAYKMPDVLLAEIRDERPKIVDH
ncbi:hypothetical protein STEG23_032983 [Scotinomys teguina]